MDVDAILDDLGVEDGQMMEKDCNEAAQSPYNAKESHMRSLEVEIQSDRERRERCLSPFCHGQNIFLTKHLQETKRSEEIQSFLSKKSQTEIKPPSQSLDANSTAPNQAYKFITAVPGTPFSVTSALNGDRVYCASQLPAGPRMEPETSGMKSSVSEISVEQITRQMCENRLRSPMQSDVGEVEGGECWMDKYAPRSFSDLVTDDRVNRELVKWLKNWRQHRRQENVQDVNLTPEGKSTDNRRQSMRTPQRASSSKEQNSKLTDFFSTPKEQATPGSASQLAKIGEERVVIICGPLGVGKTCLAKAACRICGYQSYIIDASDDCSPTILQERLSDLLGMDTFFTKQQPRCILFDEIDTLPLGAEGREAIKVIMSFIHGGKKKGSCLRRPMIFICHEIHASYLTPLRKMAKVIYIPQPKINRSLVSRLQKICVTEGVGIDLPELQHLVEASRNDISACLNSLQFQSRCEGQLFMSTKTVKVSPFKIWESILTPSIKETSSFQELCTAYEMFGEFGLIINGILANYCNLKIQDGYLIKSRGVMNFLSEACQLLWKIPTYCPILFVATRRLVQTPENRDVRMEWPRKEFENLRQITTNQKLLQDFQLQLPPMVWSRVELQSLALEFVPFLHLMHPDTSPSSKSEFCLRKEPMLMMMGTHLHENTLIQIKDTLPRVKRLEADPANDLPRKEQRKQN